MTVLSSCKIVIVFCKNAISIILLFVAFAIYNLLILTKLKTLYHNTGLGKEMNCAVTVCDREGIILYQNYEGSAS